MIARIPDSIKLPAVARSQTMPQQRSLQDSDFKERLQDLRRTDNYTNLYYLARTYAFLALVIGGTLWFYHLAESAGLSIWWNVPVSIVAVILIGAGQHHLGGLAHEGVHHILFKNRMLNELVSEWFCMFPLFSTTMHYRLQHIAHHQFVNDPERDPDISQLQLSGHWLKFPVSRAGFVRTLFKQLWIPNLLRFSRVRAQYNSTGTENNPYFRKRSKLVNGVGVAYTAGLIVLLGLLVWFNQLTLLTVVPIGVWLACMGFYAMLPERMYHQSRMTPTIPSRVVTMMRLTFITILFTGVAWLQVATGWQAALHFHTLWLVPLGTTFSLFMMLRQLVQHGNGDRGRLTNSRVFFVNRLINFAVFPMGQEYHLPHHMYASVPHYRLKELHALLMEYPEYRDQATVVEGYFKPGRRPPVRPTVVEVLGPAHAPQSQDIFIDDSVMEANVIEAE